MITRLAQVVPLVLAGWLMIMLGLTRFTDAPPAVFVMRPSTALLDALPRDIRVTQSSRIGLTLQSDQPDLAARLYALGAPLVLPAGLPRCLDLVRG